MTGQPTNALEGMDAGEVEALALMARSLRDNPKTRTQFLRLAKAANPNLVVPELELEERAGAVIGAQNKKIEELAAKDASRDAQAAANALYEALREDRVVSGRADFNALVKYAHEKGFQTSEAGLRMASQHRAAEQEAAEPTPAHVGAGTPVAINAEIMKNPIGWARAQASAAVNELFKNRKAAPLGGR